MKTLSYQDLLAEQTEHHTEFDVSTKISRHPQWGSWQHQKIELPQLSINTYKASFTEPLSIRFDDPCLSNNMNICMSLDGTTTAYSKLHALHLSLEPRRYHHVFLQDNTFDFLASPNFMNVHIQVDLTYFINLLCSSDSWMGELKNQLGKKQNHQTENALVTGEMIQVIRDILHNPLTGHFKKLFIEAKLLELVSHQFAQLSKGEKHEKVFIKNKDKEIFYAIREYLNERYAEDLSLYQLSKDFGINEFKLKKGFKETFQTTVFDFIFEKRMEEAHELLNKQHLLVHEVSSRVGYKNANHFATAFKKRFGKSPSNC